MLVSPDGEISTTLTFGTDRPTSGAVDDVDAGGTAHVRRLDVASSALFATSREAFLKCDRSQEADDLVANLCHRTRARGQRVLYQPETWAVLLSPDTGFEHHEGGTRLA